MRRNNLIAVALAASMIGTGMVARPSAEDVLRQHDGDPSPKPPPPRPAMPRAPTTEHSHSREIARRLRQQARSEAKKAAQVGGQNG